MRKKRQLSWDKEEAPTAIIPQVEKTPETKPINLENEIFESLQSSQSENFDVSEKSAIEFTNVVQPVQNQNQNQNQIPNTNQLQDEVSSNIADLISPELVVSIIDAIIARLFCKIGTWLGYNFNYNNIKLDSEEKRKLYPATKNWLKTLKFTFSPFSALLISFALVYSNKAIESGYNNKVIKAKKPTGKQRGRPRKNLKKETTISVDMQNELN